MRTLIPIFSQDSRNIPVPRAVPVLRVLPIAAVAAILLAASALSAGEPAPAEKAPEAGKPAESSGAAETSKAGQGGEPADAGRSPGAGKAVPAAEVETKERADTHVWIRTSPPGASVSVDGARIGESPRLYEVPPGARSVTVTVELDGYTGETRKVEVRGGRVTRLTFDLRPAGGPDGDLDAGAGGIRTESRLPGTPGYCATARIAAADFVWRVLGRRAARPGFVELRMPGGSPGPIVTTLVSGDHGLSIAEIRDAPSAESFLEMSVGREGGGWTVRSARRVDADGRDRAVREFRAEHRAAVEEPVEGAPSAAGAGDAGAGGAPASTSSGFPAKAAEAAGPPAPRGARGTALAFVRALAGGSAGEVEIDRDLYAGPLEARALEAMVEFARRFDLSGAGIASALVEGGRGIAVTELFAAREGGDRAGLGFSLEDLGPRWTIRDIDFLPGLEARDRFVAEFRKGHPAAVEEPIEGPREAEVREFAEAYGRALATGDAARLRECWRIEDPIDDLAGETQLALVARARARGRIRVELVVAAPIRDDLFFGCWAVQGLDPFEASSGGGDAVGADGGKAAARPARTDPWLQVFERVDGRWRTPPLPDLTSSLEGRVLKPEDLGRRATVRGLAHHRFGRMDIDERVRYLRALAEAFRRLSSPPWNDSRFEGAAAGIERTAERTDELRGLSWPEAERRILEDPSGAPRPEEALQAFYLLFYLKSDEGDALRIPEEDGAGAVAVERYPCLTEEAIADAYATEESPSGQPMVRVKLTREGKELFAGVTKASVGRTLVVVLDGKVISTATIRSEVAGGEAVITGRFTREEAERIAARMRTHRERLRAFLLEIRDLGKR